MPYRGLDAAEPEAGRAWSLPGIRVRLFESSVLLKG